MTGRAAILSWDYHEQPDLDQLARILGELSDGRLHLARPDTGSDEYALIVATRPVDQAEADRLFRGWYEDDERPDMVDLEVEPTTLNPDSAVSPNGPDE